MVTQKKENKRPRFLVRLLLFIAIIFILDFSIGSLLKYLYFKQDSGLLYRTTYALDSTRAAFLIFGSSTANHHYVPDILSQKLQMSCYNTGRDGNTIFYSYAVFQSILKRYIPEQIILDINDLEFMKDEKSYERISSLLPYYDKHPEIRSIIQLKSPLEKFKLISKIYPFNSLLFTIGAGNADFNKEREYVNDHNGYIPLEYVWKGALVVDSFKMNYQLDTIKRNIFESFISKCRDFNIHLTIIRSPEYKKQKFEDSTIKIVKRISDQYNIPFYNYTNDSFFLKHRELFYNPGHLNDSGAKIFTEMIADRIRKTNKGLINK